MIKSSKLQQNYYSLHERSVESMSKFADLVCHPLNTFYYVKNIIIRKPKTSIENWLISTAKVWLPAFLKLKVLPTEAMRILFSTHVFNSSYWNWSKTLLKQSLSWSKMPCLLWNLPQAPILSQIHPVLTLISYFFEINFNIILAFTRAFKSCFASCSCRLWTRKNVSEMKLERKAYKS